MTKFKDLLNKDILARISLDGLALLMAKLSLLINSGVPIKESLEVAGQGASSAERDFLERIRDKIIRGISLSRAISEEDFDSSDLLAAMVASGELSGNLGPSLDLMRQFYTRRAKNRKEIRTALIYPLILLLASIFVIIFMLVFILPSYMKIFESRRVNLPWSTKLLIDLSFHIKENFVILALGIFSFSILIFLLLKSNTKLKYNYDRMIVKAPLIGRYNLYFLYSYSGFCISILSKCSVPMLKIMEIIMEGTDNSFIRERIRNIGLRLEKGEEMNRAFAGEEIFSDLYISMLRIGEKTGNLAPIMLDVGNYYSERLTEALRDMTKAFEPLMILIMALLVGFIVMSVALPMFDIVNII